ncbi:OLC1v1018230C2 [Oldenlandia corymbosa var. corymbosa]|uniref:OLC1v1018230C2 n=1 Tax=Oldenlandia corymbosa var. corymbosa TaxID=529605 RepID=A0AAV1EB52_OLDCO|nr:OLC1v1018230C2 [Oldenlandia corymbosa var. corymbosa]
MAKSKGDIASSDRAKWNKIFNSLVHLLQKQQIQLQCLVKERKFLEDRIKLQHERWVFDVNLLQDQISEVKILMSCFFLLSNSALYCHKIEFRVLTNSWDFFLFFVFIGVQMKREFTSQEMEHVVEDTKADFIIGLKMRDALVYKQKFENLDSELADFREWFEYLSDKCSGEKDPSDVNEKGGEDRLALVKSAEIDALLAEKNFVWNQYRQMESNLNRQLNERRTEIESANEKIQTLLASMDKLQSSESRKDNVIEMLKSDVAKLKSELVKKDEDASRLGKELESLKKSMNMTPLLRHCSSQSTTTRSKGKDVRTMIVKKELESSCGLQKGSRSSKRKKANSDDTDTPRLFNSSFKVPKLKGSSSSVIHIH